ncbi:tigger transposable element-derived protein 2-like [Anopheles coustani]|uniref:tigger transposable element-derived protein 2-like n=1 Tax=Anopheles coustani TaxID=139045 RepID=UPI002658DF6E|nr:tigger transposable element-derived protein 2-like [Anopheles coustani]
MGGQEEFKASTGWLKRFKTRYGIRMLTTQGEILSGCTESAEAFCLYFQKFVQEENLSLDQIYNADETGLYWKCLPKKTLAAGNEKSAPGFKEPKERLTVMCCSNASGIHKLKPVVIGKSKKPRAFKNIVVGDLPVVYYSQKKQLL